MGRVLRATMSPGTWVTGIALALATPVAAFPFRQAGASDGALIVVLALFSLALARFAVSGAAGEETGSVFTSAGGTWTSAVFVWLRYLALCSLWLAPVLILGWRPEDAGLAFGALLMGMGAARTLALTVAVVVALALTPPIFLIAAVGAESFRTLVVPAAWTRILRGRAGDLFLVYSVYLGALTMTAVLLLPILAGAFAANPNLAELVGMAAFAFASGLSVTLLGRLCGSFAHHAGEILDPELDLEPAPSIPAPTTRVVAPVRSAARAESSGRADTAPPATAAMEVIAGGRDRSPHRKPPLLDAGPRVEELELQYEQDPEGALEGLSVLHAAHAQNPRVLHALCMLQARAGRPEESRETAQAALPHCLERGAIRLASEIYAAHLDHADAFALDPDAELALADELRQSRRAGEAEAAYARVLDGGAGETRAIKGLLQVAESHLRERIAYEDARRVYRYLLQRCPDSPLALHMQEGLAEAERRLAQAS